MADIDIRQVAKDPKFLKLPIEEQRKAFAELMPGFADLPVEEQDKGIGELTTAKPKPTRPVSSDNPMTGVDVGGDPFSQGVLHGLKMSGLGALQAVLKGIRSLIGMDSNQPNVSRVQSMIDEARKGSPDTFAGKAGEFTGGTLPTLAMPGGASGSAIQRLIASAMQGGTIGALQPTSGDESRLKNTLTGAAVGGGTSAALSAPKAIASIMPDRTEGRLMQSALKPSTTMKQTVKDKIYETMLKEKIPVSSGGLEKTQESIKSINKEIDNVLSVGSNKEVSRDAVLQHLADLKAKYQKDKALPKEYVDEVEGVIKEFSQRDAMIPVQQAQEFKKDLYKELTGFYENFKRYGVVKPQEWGEVRAKLAEGLRTELVGQFPELATLNAREGSLIEVSKVLERAMGRISNTNLIKLIPAVLSGSTSITKYLGVLMADHPWIKSKVAMAISCRSNTTRRVYGSRIRDADDII